MYDAVVVGSGPNGLAAAVTLAEAGKKVLVLEAAASIGGGTRSAELTLPGAIHDVCSAVHPTGAASPAFLDMELETHGLQWAQPHIPMAHPLDDGSAAVLLRDLESTAQRLGADAKAYRKTFGRVADRWDDSIRLALSSPLGALRTPISGARFGLLALQTVSGLARGFQTDQGRALVAGLGAHAIAPFNRMATAGVALTLGAAAHTVGWPVAVGGSQAIADALATRLRGLGGEIETGRPVSTWTEIPPADIVMFDTAPSAVAAIAGEQIGRRARRYRKFRHGPGVFKVDALLSEPIPWTAEEARRAGTVHVGGSYKEIAAAELEVAQGVEPERPFVLVAQPSVADPTRAPGDQQVLWAYCHVPPGSTKDMTQVIFEQIERFAPGFRSRITAVSSKDTDDLERSNANLVAGDIGGGAFNFRNLFARPTLFKPYRAAPGIYLCSASTPPGAGVHGMCGRHAARTALRDLD
jgi:phytoene dehydrogenase-like protein